ncbi:MAG: deaminase [Oscillospiraceae bacterium]|nr:deaminase [Oscillospiraceae bacterium]
MERISKINYYLDIAQTVASRSTCLRKKYGAIIVKNDVIISTGFNGAPRGRQNCCDRGTCIREELKIPRGERFELCRSVHGEANAIIAAPRDQMLDSDMYETCVAPVTGNIIGDVDSCQMCKRLIINAGIKRVIYRDSPTEYRTVDVADWVTDDDSLGKIGY